MPNVIEHNGNLTQKDDTLDYLVETEVVNDEKKRFRDTKFGKTLIYGGASVVVLSSIVAAYLGMNNNNMKDVDIASPVSQIEEVVETPATIDEVILNTPVEVVDPIQPDPKPDTTPVEVINPYQTLTNDYLTSETINEVASDTYNLNGVTNGTIAVTDLGELATELGLAETVENIAYTTSIQEDGSTVSYIETNTEAVGMYNGESNLEATSASDLNASVGDLEAVIISNTDGTSTVIKAGDEGFDAYKSNLEQQKKDIQWDKLTNLDYLLDGATIISTGDIYTKNNDTFMYKYELYNNSEKNLNVLKFIVDSNNSAFFVDEGINSILDHQYTSSSTVVYTKNLDLNQTIKDIYNLSKNGEIIDTDRIYSKSSN